MIDWDRLVGTPTVAIFGQPVAYTSTAGGALFPITGVYDEAYTELAPLNAGEGGEPSFISTTRPVLGVQLGQFLVPPAQGDSLVVGGTQFWVREVRPDGHGHAKLMLNYNQGQMP